MESIPCSNVIAVSPYRSLQGRQKLVAYVDAKLSTRGSLTGACWGLPQLRMIRDIICKPQAFIAVMDDSQPKQDGKDE